MDRFWAKVDRSGGPDACWNWTASTTADGYGRFRVRPESSGESQKALAHRVAYELLVGPIPDGLQIDHLCRNRGCVNPAHLEPVTGQENTLRGDTIPASHAAQTHCTRGHLLSGANLRLSPNGARVCRACARERWRQHLDRMSPDEREMRKARQRAAAHRYRQKQVKEPRCDS